MLAGCTTGTGTGTVASRWSEAVEAGDLDALMALYADDAALDDPHFGELREPKVEIRLSYSRVFSGEDVSFTVGDSGVGDELAFVTWEWSGVDRSDGERFTVEGISILVIEDGLIRRETVYYGNIADSPFQD